MRYRGEFRTIDSEPKAYFLGLFTADGNLHRRRKPKGSHISLAMHRKHVGLANKLIQYFPFFVMEKKPAIIRFHAYDPRLYDDLRTFVLERKSYENKEKLFVPDLPDKLDGPYIRGFFDGDGSASLQKNGQSLNVEMACVSNRYTRELRSLLRHYGISTRVYVSKRTRKRDKQPVNRIYVSQKDMETFSRLIYTDSDLFLLYKKRNIERYLTHRRTWVPKSVLCEACGHREKTKYGHKKGKQRFYCRFCDRYTTELCHPDLKGSGKTGQTRTPRAGVAKSG